MTIKTNSAVLEVRLVTAKGIAESVGNLWGGQCDVAKFEDAVETGLVVRKGEVDFTASAVEILKNFEKLRLIRTVRLSRATDVKIRFKAVDNCDNVSYLYIEKA